MIPLLRFSSALLAIMLAVPAVAWLLLICADFVGLDDCLHPQGGWLTFAAVVALAITVPPALYAWPDDLRNGKALLREGARAALLSFALFAVLFLLGARPFFHWLDLPGIMIPIAAGNIAPLLACPAMFLSYRICRALLQRPGPASPAPASMHIFGWLALLFVLSVAFHPWMTEGRSLLFTDRVSLLCAAWVFVALRQVLLVRGEGGFAPAWGMLCLLCAFRLGTTLPGASAMELLAASIILGLALSSSFCLLHPESRRWLC